MDLSNPPTLHGREAARAAPQAGPAPGGAAFDVDLAAIARIAAAAMRTRGAAIALVDDDGTGSRARHGIPVEETPRSAALGQRIAATGVPLVVPDASLDPRLRANAQPSSARFFAGVPLFAGSGRCIGSLCVIDDEPRPLVDEGCLALLEDCAGLAAQIVDARQARKLGEVAARAVQATSDAVLATDGDGTIVFWNSAAERLFGYPVADAVGRDVSLIIPGTGRVRRLLEMVGGLARSPGKFIEIEASNAAGDVFPIELSLAAWSIDESSRGLALVMRDVSDRKRLEGERQRAQAFLDTVVTNLPAMLFVKDARTRKYLLVNRKAEEIVGRAAESMLGRSDGELFPALGRDFERRDTAAAILGRPHVHESEFVRDDGAHIHVRTTRLLIDGPDRKKQYILGMSEDMSQIRRAEAENARLARYDTLTGLLNRASFTGLLHELVARRTPFALVSIDLDRFKAVNDQFGHVVGDEVLQQVGDRLRECTCDADKVARVGGDEFAAILTGEDLRARASDFAARVIGSLAQPISSGRVTAHLGASIGIAVHPDDGRTIKKLRENVDLALYRAKGEGRGVARFFDDEMDAAVRERSKLEADLRTAVSRNQITLAYQPIVSAVSGKATSVEALARWNHETRGPIRPDVFISLAEDIGLIEELGRRLLRQACYDATRWRADLRVAVNLSPLQFQSGRLVEMVAETLGETGLAPERLLLEITERLVIQDTRHAFAQLEGLRSLGIQVLIDDFGVGHSSLNYFQRFPFDKVKIDKSFIDEIQTSRAAKAIVQAVVGLARQLSMAIVAEGVESAAQMQLLVRLGCTHLQGYLFSEPLRADEVGEVCDRVFNLEDAAAIP